MSVIKIEISIPEAIKAIKQFKKNRIGALDEISTGIKHSASSALNELLNSAWTKTYLLLYLWYFQANFLFEELSYFLKTNGFLIKIRHLSDQI